jgi:hypothetical protein
MLAAFRRLPVRILVTEVIGLVGVEVPSIRGCHAFLFV